MPTTRLKAKAVASAPQTRSACADDIKLLGDLQRSFDRQRADMNDLIAEITKNYQPALEQLATQIATLQEGVQTRTVLFETLEGVKAGTVDLDKARAINDVAKTIIDTAKVEVDYLRVTDGGESSFISSAVGANNLPPGLPNGASGGPVNGITGVVRHRLR